MAQYSTSKGSLLNTNDALYEVVMIAGSDGTITSGVGTSAAEAPAPLTQLPSGRSHINKFGFNDQVPDTFEVIAIGSSNFSYPTNAGVATVVSDDTNDDDGDVGARTVSIQGLDGDYNEVTETVTLDGTNSVTTDASFLRIFRMRVETAGSSEGAEGIITASVGGNELARINPNFDNQTLQAAYTVPAGKTAYLLRMQSTSTKDNKAAMVGLFTRSNAPDSVFTVKQLVEVYRNNVVVDFPIPLRIDEKTDIEIRGKNLNAGNVSIGGTFDLILIDND